MEKKTTKNRDVLGGTAVDNMIEILLELCLDPQTSVMGDMADSLFPLLKERNRDILTKLIENWLDEKADIGLSRYVGTPNGRYLIGVAKDREKGTDLDEGGLNDWESY